MLTEERLQGIWRIVTEKGSASIQELMDAGTDYSTAVAMFDTEENFQEWLTQFKQELAATQEGK